MKKITVGILDFTGILMNFGISRRPFTELDMLQEKIVKMGYKSRIYRAHECQIYFDGQKTQALEKNKPFELCDVLIPRVDLTNRLDLELALLKQFEMMDVPVVNGYFPTLCAKNKLRTTQLLTKKRIPVPKTVVVRKFQYLDGAVAAVGGYPVILKAPFGSYGVGVVIVESARSLYSALDLLHESSSSNIFMIQEYIAEAEGSDYRAFVVNDEVIASMQRTAKVGDFRSNLNLGGEGVKVELTSEEKNLAIRATKALGLQVAGVDILRSKKGPLIMEVNSNAGFMGLSEVTKVDVAGHIVQYAVEFSQQAKKREKSFQRG